MGSYCALSFVYYLQAENYLIGPFLLIYALGFCVIGCRSLSEQFARNPYPLRACPQGAAR